MLCARSPLHASAFPCSLHTPPLGSQAQRGRQSEAQRGRKNGSSTRPCFELSLQIKSARSLCCKREGFCRGRCSPLGGVESLPRPRAACAKLSFCGASRPHPCSNSPTQLHRSTQHSTPPQQLIATPTPPRSTPSLPPSSPLLTKSCPGGPSSPRARNADTSAAMTSPSPSPANGRPPRVRSLDVAVIGAGAAGLVAVRELLREGHRSVTVLEQDPDLGGVWRYDPRQEDNPLGSANEEGSQSVEQTDTTDSVATGISDRNQALNPKPRRQVHSSMYASLRTNLPRELMGFTDFPFSHPLPFPEASGREDPEGGDPRRFPGHKEVLRYLRLFAKYYNVEGCIQYNTRVLSVELLGREPGLPPFQEASGPSGPASRVTTDQGPEAPSEVGQEHNSCADADESRAASWPKFAVTTVDLTREEDGASVRVFDAVVVCNGHYSQPRLAQIPGIEHWPGQQMHSHNYRHPDDFTGKVVVLLGAGSSGDDLSKEISHVAKSVHVASRGWTSLDKVPQRMPDRWPNLYYHPMVERASADGAIRFLDGTQVRADIVFYCTGYTYSFPFLKSLAHVVSVDNNRVGPLYKHLFPPALAPGLSFLGLPWKVVPFPLVELQAKWVACLLSGSAPGPLPPVQAMLQDTHELSAELAAHAVPQDYTHCLSLPQVPTADQFVYDNWLADQCGYRHLSRWREPMYNATSARKRREPWAYRDTWDDEDSLGEALEELLRMIGQSDDGLPHVKAEDENQVHQQ